MNIKKNILLMYLSMYRGLQVYTRQLTTQKLNDTAWEHIFTFFLSVLEHSKSFFNVIKMDEI